MFLTMVYGAVVNVGSSLALEVTTLGIRKPGDSVNLETDILGKYVQRFLLETDPGKTKQGK